LSASAGGGNTLVKATRAFGVPLNLSTGDSTTALRIGERRRRYARHHDSCDRQLAIYRTNCDAESVSETCTIACRARRDSEVIDGPAHNHLGRNLD